MRALGVRDVFVYCGNPEACSHGATPSADRWPDEITLSKLDRRMLCSVCGHLGADVRPGFKVRSRM